MSWDYQWGYHTPEAEGSPAVWGARAIWPNRYGPPNFPLDLLPDRQSMRGEKADRDGLAYILNNGVLDAVQARMTAYDRSGLVRPDTRNEVVLYDSCSVKVIGNSNASHGYFYVTAFIKPVDLTRQLTYDDKELDDFEAGEFVWSAYRIPAVGEEIVLGTGNPGGNEHVGRRVKVIGHAIEAKHLFLLVPCVEPDREDLKRDRDGLLDALRTGTVPRLRGDSPEDRVRKDPTDCLWLPHGPSTMVMGREWQDLPELLESVETRHGTCTLERGVERFIMTSPATGVHSLSIDCTDATRLQAHWTGFVGTNNAPT
jgi:hypothetical protein